VFFGDALNRGEFIRRGDQPLLKPSGERPPGLGRFRRPALAGTGPNPGETAKSFKEKAGRDKEPGLPFGKETV
jgi:hypothetical protein